MGGIIKYSVANTDISMIKAQLTKKYYRKVFVKKSKSSFSSRTIKWEENKRVQYCRITERSHFRDRQTDKELHAFLKKQFCCTILPLAVNNSAPQKNLCCHNRLLMIAATLFHSEFITKLCGIENSLVWI